jgi:hypothetical protein
MVTDLILVCMVCGCNMYVIPISFSRKVLSSLSKAPVGRGTDQVGAARADGEAALADPTAATSPAHMPPEKWDSEDSEEGVKRTGTVRRA